MRRRTTNNSCFTISIFLIVGWIMSWPEEGKKYWGRKCEKYLVFEIRGSATRLKEWLRISQDDSFSSFIDHILKEGFQVFIPLTHHLFSNANVFTFMFFHVFHWKRVRKRTKEGEYQWNWIVVDMFQDDWVDQRPWIENSSNPNPKDQSCWPILMILQSCPFQTWIWRNSWVKDKKNFERGRRWYHNSPSRKMLGMESMISWGRFFFNPVRL